MDSKTAILIFANSSDHESLHKHLPKHTIEVLNDSTLKLVKATGLPYFHISEKEQIGDNFGERFTSAITSVFAKGFTNVISIGNDTPHLSKKHINKAVLALTQNNCVIGPSNDGGFYLIGLCKSHFNAELFLKLPWQSKKLSRAISAISTRNNTRICYLEKFQDIDTFKDIQLVFNHYKSLNFQIKKVLTILLYNIKKIECYSIQIIEYFFQIPNYNKGSPLVLILK